MTEGTEGLFSNTRMLWDVCGSGMDNINIMKLLMSKIEKCSGKIIIQHQLSLDTNIIYHFVSDWPLVSDIFPRVIQVLFFS